MKEERTNLKTNLELTDEAIAEVKQIMESPQTDVPDWRKSRRQSMAVSVKMRGGQLKKVPVYVSDADLIIEPTIADEMVLEEFGEYAGQPTIEANGMMYNWRMGHDGKMHKLEDDDNDND